jgi:hypothetical protein
MQASNYRVFRYRAFVEWDRVIYASKISFRFQNKWWGNLAKRTGYLAFDTSNGLTKHTKIFIGNDEFFIVKAK